jgi:hypothetical protein
MAGGHDYNLTRWMDKIVIQAYAVFQREDAAEVTGGRVSVANAVPDGVKGTVLTMS